MVTAALGLCAAAPAAVAAALPENFFGVISTDPPSTNDLQRMAGAGVETVRLGVNWASVEGQPGARDWRFYDSQIGGIAAAGLTASPQLLGVPSWIHSHPAHPPVYNEAERSAWSRFVTDFAARYGSNGAFWKANPTLPYKPLTDWEVWNEANLRGYWDGKPNARRYLELLKITRDALRLGDPGARIVLGGIFPNPRRKYGVSIGKFLTALYRAPGSRDAFDALAIHPFSTRPRDVLQTCLDARRLMARHHDARTPLLVTELGWTTGGTGWKQSPYQATERDQAKNLSRSFRLLIRSRGRLRLEGIVWHTWQDVDGPGRTNWLFEMGLLRSDGTAKPSLGAFTKIAT